MGRAQRSSQGKLSRSERIMETAMKRARKAMGCLAGAKIKMKCRIRAATMTGKSQYWSRIKMLVMTWIVTALCAACGISSDTADADASKAEATGNKEMCEWKQEPMLGYYAREGKNIEGLIAWHTGSDIRGDVLEWLPFRGYTGEMPNVTNEASVRMWVKCIRGQVGLIGIYIRDVGQLDSVEGIELAYGKDISTTWKIRISEESGQGNKKKWEDENLQCISKGAVLVSGYDAWEWECFGEHNRIVISIMANGLISSLKWEGEDIDEMLVIRDRGSRLQLMPFSPTE